MNNKNGFSPVIIAVIVVILLGGGYVVYKNYQKPVVQIPSVTSTPITSASDLSKQTDTTKNWKTYTNKKFGFELRFPDRWRSVVISEKNGLPPNFQNVDFSLKNSGTSQEVFAIVILSKTEWERHMREDALTPETKISERNGKVFVFVTGQDDAGFDDFPPITQINATVPYEGPYFDVETKIIPTFKFTN